MRNQVLLLLLTLCLPLTLMAQSDSTATLPYREIPEYPSAYTAGSILSRMIDGLGYRYYWATEGLTTTDLAYLPKGEDTRSSFHTLQHIHGLAQTIYNVAKKKPNIRPATPTPEDFEVLRRETLTYLREASKAFLEKTSEEVEEHKIVFQSSGREYEYPLWHLLNGQIADALYHTGQVVSYRRSSGNPIDPRVSVFTGKTRE